MATPPRATRSGSGSGSDDPATARLRILLVDPAHRGLGIGVALVDGCVELAVAERPHHSFGHDRLGRTWARRLT
ncbi:MAG: GNAT family N-acetyltransferase [Nocardioides sp.]